MPKRSRIIALIRREDFETFTRTPPFTSAEVHRIEQRQTLRALIPVGRRGAIGQRHPLCLREAVDEDPFALPAACLGLVLAQPSGGVKRRLTAHRHFSEHMRYVQDHGLAGVVALVREKGSFPQVPATGPWAAVIAQHASFAKQFVRQDVDRYLALVSASCHSLFDRDTIPGAEPEELMALKLPALILPGHTDFHTTSCARYLEECILGSEYWDVHFESQPPELIRDRSLGFLTAHTGVGRR